MQGAHIRQVGVAWTILDFKNVSDPGSSSLRTFLVLFLFLFLFCLFLFVCLFLFCLFVCLFVCFCSRQCLTSVDG